MNADKAADNNIKKEKKYDDELVDIITKLLILKLMSRAKKENQ